MTSEDALAAMTAAIECAKENGCSCTYPDATFTLCDDGHIHGVQVMHEDSCYLYEIERRVAMAPWN